MGPSSDTATAPFHSILGTEYNRRNTHPRPASRFELVDNHRMRHACSPTHIGAHARPGTFESQRMSGVLGLWRHATSYQCDVIGSSNARDRCVLLFQGKIDRALMVWIEL